MISSITIRFRHPDGDYSLHYATDSDGRWCQSLVDDTTGQLTPDHDSTGARVWVTQEQLMTLLHHGTRFVA